MKRKYLIRLDDACPTMNIINWGRIESILDNYSIKPMVGIIPNNEDLKQQIDPEDKGFWEKVRVWGKKGWTIALHGYNHCYISKNGLKGLNPIWEKSEFAGVPIKEQREKIRKGVAIMREQGINPNYFFAPSHTFDENTLIALREESGIRIISDTIATKPYRYGDFIFIPQISGQCREMKLKGLFTFCLHPSTMTDDDFNKTDLFLNKHQQEFISFDAIDLSNIEGKSNYDKILSWGYFTMRKLKRRI